MKSTTVALLLFVTAFSNVVQAQEDDTVVKAWLARQMVAGSGAAPFDIATAETRTRAVYAVLLTRNNVSENGLPRMRAQRIAKFLEKDLDNDGNVTSAELREVLALQASRPLTAASGLRVDPTKEQSENILQQLLDKELVADKNGDGTLDFAEMREHASQESVKNFGMRVSLSLRDPTAIRVLDSSGDKTISEAEFLDATRKTFAAADADKDGKFSRQEALPLIRPRNATTF